MQSDLKQQPDDHPHCEACGYILTGLPRTGLCPECGRDYDVEALICTVPRPPLARLLFLVTPGLFLVALWTLYSHLVCGDLCVVALFPITFLPLTISISRRLSESAYFEAVRRARLERPCQPGPSMSKPSSGVLFILQFLASRIAYVVFVCLVT